LRDESLNASENIILSKAKQLGCWIEECFAFDGRYYIVDMSSHRVIAGARDFLEWGEVVQWALEADIPRTLRPKAEHPVSQIVPACLHLILRKILLSKVVNGVFPDWYG